MRAPTTRFWCSCVVTFALFAAAAVPAVGGEDATVNAFASWWGQGRTFKTGTDEATFIGVLIGPMYVETEKGILKSGKITCPAVVDLGIEDASQQGKGRCIITAQDGAKIYAEITCSGVFMVGCNGELKLTGGTQRFSGISGGGKLTIRSDLQQFVKDESGDSFQEDATGSLNLTGLHYKLP